MLYLQTMPMQNINTDSILKMLIVNVFHLFAPGYWLLVNKKLLQFSGFNFKQLKAIDSNQGKNMVLV